MKHIVLMLAAAMAVSGLAGCKRGRRGGSGDEQHGLTIDVQAVLNRECGRCHGLERVETHHWGRNGWQIVLDKMVSEGAQLTKPELEGLVDYLAERDKGRRESPAPVTD